MTQMCGRFTINTNYSTNFNSGEKKTPNISLPYLLYNMRDSKMFGVNLRNPTSYDLTYNCGSKG